MKHINFNHLSRVHFVGIGGIGTSAIARMLLGRGVKISGSDRATSAVTKSLTRAGANISIGHTSDIIPDGCDLVVHTVAIPHDNPELVQARQRGMPIATYPEMLELISAEKYTVAVAGTHGKTTTTAMLGSILLEAGVDPTILVGGLMFDPRQKNISTPTFEQHGVNFILGASDYFVVEADEYRKSFLHLAPRLVVITNIDADHLDFYKDIDDIQATFAELVRRIPPEGYIVCNPNDAHIRPVLSSARGRVVDYTQCILPKLMVPGKHNYANAQAAATAAQMLGVSFATIENSVKNFPGTWRRFQYKGTTSGGALVYDDYAHNPQKVSATIAGARELYPDRRLVVIFQPHLYSRTKQFFMDFINALAAADKVVLTPIYAAREAPDASISSNMLAEKLIAVAPHTTAIACLDFSEAKRHLSHELSEKDVVVVMGAGNSTELADALVY